MAPGGADSLAQADTVGLRAHIIPHFGISVETIGDELTWGVSSIHWGARLELERPGSEGAFCIQEAHSTGGR